MDELPIELFEMIFSYLNLKDRVNCRRVNKKWKSRLDDFKIRSLVISGAAYDSRLHYLRWIHKNQFISMQNCVEVSDLNKLLNFKRSTNYLPIDNLKELVIHRFEYFLNDPNFEKFNQIEKLFIENSINNWDFSLWRKNNQELILNLPNLKELKVNYNIRRITFILPKLRKLDLRAISETSFIHPETIEYANFDAYHESVEKFVNLKVLICDSLLDSDLLKNDFLLKIRSINEIQTDNATLFNRLLIQKRRFELNDLNLYFCGLNTNSNVEKIYYQNVLCEKNLNRYLNNYSKMANQIHTIDTIIYNDIERVYSNLPDDFIKKFINLQKIEIRGPIRDESQFVEFLKKTKTIESLDFEISGISKKLLKTISKIHPNLALLVIKKDGTEELTENDLDAVFYFSNLTDLHFKVFHISDSSSLEKKLLLNLKNLRHLKFTGLTP